MLRTLVIAASLATGGQLVSRPAPATPATIRFATALANPAPAPALLRVPRRPARASRSGVRRPLTRWVRPAYGPLTSPFGWRWGRMHEGIDIGAPWGAPIYAAGDGVVTYAGPESGYGQLLLIRHVDGTVTAYGHMSRFAVRGGRVKAGQVVAYVGTAGDATGPHLHFEVRIGGRKVNPLPWLRRHGVRI